MAEPKVDSYPLTPIERQWVVVALTTQRSVLVRSRNKEMTGGDIWLLRGKEIDALSALITRLS